MQPIQEESPGQAAAAGQEQTAAAGQVEAPSSPAESFQTGQAVSPAAVPLPKDQGDQSDTSDAISERSAARSAYKDVRIQSDPDWVSPEDPDLRSSSISSDTDSERYAGWSKVKLHRTTTRVQEKLAEAERKEVILQRRLARLDRVRS